MTRPRRAVLLLLGAAVVWAGSIGAARHGARTPRRLALFIGIADYQHFAPGGPSGQSDLNGPPNDVARMREALRRFGFDGDSNVRVLRDATASRAGIAAGFRWLAERATDSADAVVIYYSGHGSSARDANGDEALVTPGDTMDEALVPWDAADVHDARQLVIDDQIGDWLKALGTTNVTMIVDACFSGTVTRGPATRSRAHPKGSPAVGSVTTAPNLAQLLTNPAHTLITAAGPTETATELERGDHHWSGVLTDELARALDEAGPATRYDEIMRDVVAGVHGTPEALQTPQLEGDRTALLFHVRAGVAARPFVLVTAGGGGGGGTRVTIDAGAVHGVRRSAVYDVFPPGDETFTGTPLAQLQVDSVGESSSVGHLLEGATAGAVPQEARGVLAVLPRGAHTSDTLRLFVEPSAAAVRPAIAALPFVTVADSASADARLLAIRGEPQVVVAGVPLPRLPTDTSLCGLLARALAITTFSAIDNPAAPQGLQIQVRLTPHGRGPGDEERAVDTVYVGESYDLWVRVRATETSTFYLTAAIEGFAGAPMLLYPEQTPNQPFPLNEWKALMVDQVMAEPSGVEIIKLLVDSDQFDFHTLLLRFDKCTGSRDLGGASPFQPRPVVGWRARSHQFVLLPAAARPRP